MPNRNIDDPLRGLAASVSALMNNWKLDVVDLINNPTSEKVWVLVSDITTGLSTRYDRNFSEAGLLALIEYVLRRLNQRFQFTIDSEYKYGSGAHRANLRLATASSVLILELKRLRPVLDKSDGFVVKDVRWVDYSELLKQRTFTNDQTTAKNKQLEVPCVIDTSESHLVECHTIEELRDNALLQAENYGLHERRPNPTKAVAVCSVIHWTQLLTSDMNNALGQSIIVVSSVKTIPCQEPMSCFDGTELSAPLAFRVGEC